MGTGSGFGGVAGGEALLSGAPDEPPAATGHAVRALRPAAPAPRVVALDGLRGAMAWAVATYHFALFTGAFEPGGVTSSALAVFGVQSVEAFFALSGFCLFHVHGDL